MHRLSGWLVAVKSHVAGVSEGNHQFTKFGNLIERPANVGG